jgi:hypothetical protein
MSARALLRLLGLLGLLRLLRLLRLLGGLAHLARLLAGLAGSTTRFAATSTHHRRGIGGSHHTFSLLNILLVGIRTSKSTKEIHSFLLLTAKKAKLKIKGEFARGTAPAKGTFGAPSPRNNETRCCRIASKMCKNPWIPR